MSPPTCLPTCPDQPPTHQPGNGICLTLGGRADSGHIWSRWVAKENLLVGGVKVAGRGWVEWEEQKSVCGACFLKKKKLFIYLGCTGS